MDVGMSDSSRHLTHRRSPGSASHHEAAAVATAPLAEHVSVSSAARVEALRKLVAAGQYHVSAKWLAHRIFRCAGIPVEE
jgi:anti-sigma28 factor (negative regulator of flagellin synthesis)